MFDSWKKNPKQELGENWEKEAILELAQASLKESKRQRRWANLFKGAMLLYLVAIAWGIMAGGKGATKEDVKPEHIAKIQLSGMISESSDFNAQDVGDLLNRAFSNKNSVGVILELNSPGGSPVQSKYIYDEINRYKVAYPDKPVKAVISDVCASGCYYVASAADEIIADGASIVGSIGVIMSGFGFADAIEKLGVERRVIAAGKNKALLDPFSSRKPEHIAHIEGMLSVVHEQFIDAVITGRKGKLTREQDIYNGLVWSGEQALDIGLIDSLGSTYTASSIGYPTDRVVNYEKSYTTLEKLTRGMAVTMSSHLESRLMSMSMQ